MIPELGHFALILALCLALLQVIAPLLARIGKQNHCLAFSQSAAFGQLLFLLFSYACLTYAFVNNDFSVLYVASNSSRELPVWYRLTAVWGGHEGSMLLWVMILSFWGAAVACLSSSLPDQTRVRVLAVIAWISVGFLLFLLATSNPFLRLLPDIPDNGRDLNPLLQDPGFLIHPPMLYMGYVGFVVVFAFAITALIEGKVDAVWTRWVRPWTLVAWCFLTFGIVLGSWWAYRELGWGGWWFWDPVENASFLPWLAATALIHSLLVTEKRGAFKSWTILLAITTFSLSLLGTFLVRSGVLTSVHAFAVDPTRGLFMLVFLFLVITISLLLYAIRSSAIRGGEVFNLLSRETCLLLNNVLLVVAMLTVLLGTLYPLIIDALQLAKLSVGAPYFNTVFVPLIAPLLFFMGIGPNCHWQTMKVTALLQRLRFAFIISLTVGVLLPWILTDRFSAGVALGVVLALWIVIATIQDWLKRVSHHQAKRWQCLFQLPRAYYGMLSAHLGIAVCVLGVTLTSYYSIERDVRMGLGDSTNVGAYTFQFLAVNTTQGPNYEGISGEFAVTKRDRSVAQLQAQKKFYTIQQSMMTKSGIRAGFLRDLYVALGEQLADGDWIVRLYYKPFVRWIWLGGLLIVLGGILAASDKHYYLRSKQQGTMENSV